MYDVVLIEVCAPIIASELLFPETPAAIEELFTQPKN